VAFTAFISDLHLAAERPAIVDQFFDFVSGAARQADALYVLGDLFEYWAGDDDMEDRLNGVVADAFAALHASGTGVYFLHGNRDFLVGDAFARRAQATLLSDPALIDLYGTPTLLMHGDTLCTDDREYQALRAQVRNPAWQERTLAMPIAQRVAMAKGLREKSESAKGGKSMEIMDVASGAVERAFLDCDCDLMIHGHTHRPARHDLVVGGRRRVRWVLPDWYERGGYLEASPEGIRALETA
jgi:UDP-2,3-diacylglucosamine hydrolase